MLGLIGIVFLLIGAYAEQIPDYDKPYSPIYTDKEVYTWTDKIRITIAAPSWNENRYGIDSIGDDADHPVKISTSSHSLEPYRLTETAPNSGIFTGEVVLTGFSHDADGDGQPDTQPRTMGVGPTSGLLETKRDDGITISFEFADGVVLTKSAQVSWNFAEIEFSSPNYLVTDEVLIKVRDADMNLNPEALDQLNVDVSSDSDSAGVSVAATETSEDSGIFETLVVLTQTNDSSGNRLLAIPGNTITARYEDRTLPSPYSISDEQDVMVTSIVESNIPDIEKITVADLYIADSTGKQISELRTDQRVQIVTNIQNNEGYPQEFTCIIQVSDSQDTVILLSWIGGELSAGQSFEVSQSWTPTKSDDYKIETFVWKSLGDARPLSTSYVKSVYVE
ncbi:MAG TPA: hypothetical protein VD828_01140 [Candidatus Nitrosotenuis sp.]|nr:hypothetical protein [Candidatus Nitrosotenuis sp.]